MKTSIFNMTLTLPPLIEMTEVEKDMSGRVLDKTIDYSYCMTYPAACCVLG